MLKIVCTNDKCNSKRISKDNTVKKSRTLKSKFKLGIMSSVLNLNAKI